MVFLTQSAATARLLDTLPPRRQPPKSVPPLRRPEVLAGPFDTREQAQAAAETIRATAKGGAHG